MPDSQGSRPACAKTNTVRSYRGPYCTIFSSTRPLGPCVSLPSRSLHTRLICLSHLLLIIRNKKWRSRYYFWFICVGELFMNSQRCSPHMTLPLLDHMLDIWSDPGTLPWCPWKPKKLNLEAHHTSMKYLKAKCKMQIGFSSVLSTSLRKLPHEINLHTVMFANSKR